MDPNTSTDDTNPTPETPVAPETTETPSMPDTNQSSAPPEPSMAGTTIPVVTDSDTAPPSNETPTVEVMPTPQAMPAETAVADAPAPETPAPDTPPAAAPVVTGSQQVAPVVSSVDAAIQASTSSKAVISGGKRSFKSLLLALLVVIILGGGSAAAYFGVVVPNKPANILKSAIANSLQSKGGTFDGTLHAGPATGAGLAYKATISGSSNVAAKSADFTLTLDVSGISFPVEARYVGGNLYIKVGDLSQISGLVSSLSPESGGIVTQLSGAVSNKWFELDSTVIDEAGGSCLTDVNWSLNKADVTLLENAYSKHPFTTITSSSGDTIKGKKVEKLVLSIDDDKAATYLKNLDINNLSLVQKIKKCEKGVTTQPGSYSSLADHDKTPITLWIDKGSHQIVRADFETTAQDAKKSNEKGGATVDFGYTLPTIAAPKGAESITQLITDITKALGVPGVDPTTVLNGLLSSSSNQAQAGDTKRKTDIQSVQVQLEAYASDHNGHYPSFKDLNSSSWRAKNMPNLDASALQDPSASSQTLAIKPAKNIYAYQVTTASGASCEANDTQCAKYTLTATLSDGTAYTQTSLQ